ncbi:MULTISPECIES: tail fiber domain-containing protein [unclassified Serratia (in: enterobacteria)]|uniref:tail fiber domain-containing protein n=1 Tax=unclassified Serratia (in: enterobacteria) TaxID=2647522 RepID=UPI00046AB474|nr:MULTISPECIES: tail fiber domain-containing protein [unclassified Serratia (in: enterobacteria)]
MAEEKKNAQVLGGVNDDITELKSLSTLRKRMISDGEIVTKSANGFRLAFGNTGVMLRNDGQAFYVLTTPSGQAQDGQWNTLRPFAFSLSTGRVSLSNGVDVSGGALVSHNAGIGAVNTGPTPLISGQTYGAPAVYTNFTTGNVTTTMMMGSRVIPGKEDTGLLSYRDLSGKWNEIHVRANSELSAGRLEKSDPNGWIIAKGNKNVNNNADRTTYGLRLEGQGSLFTELCHYERIGQHHLMGLRVANGGGDGWYESRDKGNAYTNGAWHSSSDARMKTEIVKIDGALDKLDKISGYTYLKQGVPEAGVIAQEIENILPQSVTTTELKLNDGSILKDARGININGVVALLIEALKEESETRRQLESRLATLEESIISNQS